MAIASHLGITSSSKAEIMHLRSWHLSSPNTCWGRHLRVDDDEDEEGEPEELGAKPAKRRPESREATRRGAKRRRPPRRDGARAEVASSEAIPMALSGEAAKTFGGEEKRPHCQSPVRNVQL